MYDVDGNGVIELQEMIKIVASIYKMMGGKQVWWSSINQLPDGDGDDDKGGECDEGDDDNDDGRQTGGSSEVTYRPAAQDNTFPNMIIYIFCWPWSLFSFS